MTNLINLFHERDVFVIYMLFDSLEDLYCVLNLRKIIATVFLCTLIKHLEDD